MKHYGDITRINGFAVEPVSVVIGGSPCQDLSVAGKRAGLSGARSGLFMEQIRIIKELRNADESRGRTGADVRPRYMVWENVPGAFSSNHGEDFGAVLQETVRIIEPQAPAVPTPNRGWPMAGCLVGEGGGTPWSVAWRVLDAQFWGVPQRRRRIALVADFGGERAPEILFERESVPWDYPSCGAPRQRSPLDAERRADDAECGELKPTVFALDSVASNSMKSPNPHSGFHEADVARCLDTTDGNPTKNQGGNVVVDVVESVAFTRQQHGSYVQSDVASTKLAHLAIEGDDLVCFPDTARALTARYEGSPCLDRGPNLVAVMKERAGKPGGGKGALVGYDTAFTIATHPDQSLCCPTESGMKCLNPWDSQTVRQYDADGVFPTLTSNNGGGQNRVGVCYPINEMIATRCKQLGERTGLGIGKDGDPAFTLQASHPHAVCVNSTVFAAGFKAGQSEHAGIGYADEQAATLTSGSSGLEPTVFCIQGNCIDRADTAGCNGKGWKEDMSYTLNTIDRPAVVYDARGNGSGCVAPTIIGDHENRVTDYTALVAAVDCRNASESEDVNGTLQAKSNGGLSNNLNNVLRCGYCVRRMTPTECERLQGYPDGWTNIGAWVDTNGKTHPESTDSQRYKALGNSIALPPWLYVLQRLSLCCEGGRTMASLFDGIGGFPLIWEYLNGKGSCLWASEIEEFPIAATKRHFPDTEVENENT